MLSPKQHTETAVERALKHAFPQTAFKVEVNDATRRACGALARRSFP